VIDFDAASAAAPTTDFGCDADCDEEPEQESAATSASV